MTDYPIVVDGSAVDAGALETVSSDRVREQLADLVSSLAPLMEPGSTPGNLHLDSVEIGLTLTAEGKVAFLAKVGLEASIVLKFTTGQSDA